MASGMELSSAHRDFIRDHLEKTGESVKFESWVNKVRGTSTKTEKRILAIGEFRFVTFRVSTLKGISVAREAHFRQVTKVTADDECLDIQCTDFAFGFMSERLEEAATAFAEAYDWCMHGQPAERFATFDVRSDAATWFLQVVEAATAARPSSRPVSRIAASPAADPTLASSAGLRAGLAAAAAEADGCVVARDDVALALRILRCEITLRGQAVAPEVQRWLQVAALSPGRDLVLHECVAPIDASGGSPRRRTVHVAPPMHPPLRAAEWMGADAAGLSDPHADAARVRPGASPKTPAARRARGPGVPRSPTPVAQQGQLPLPRAPWTATEALTRALVGGRGPHAAAVITDTLLEAVADVLALTDCFASLDASGVPIGCTGSGRLAPALSSARVPSRLVLAGCAIGPAGAAALGAALEQGDGAALLRTLVLSDNPITDKGLRALLPGVCRCSRLQRLELARCGLTRASLCPLFDALNRAPSPTPVLASVDIGGNAPGAKGSSSLAAWLQGPAGEAVQTLGVAHTGVAWPPLAAALQRAEGGVPVVDASGAAPASAADVGALASSLAATSAPRVLVLDHWEKDSAGLAAVVGGTVLSAKRTSVAISLRHTALARAFAPIASACAASTSLRALDLSHTAIDAPSLAGFCSALAGPLAAPSLRLLVLDACLDGASSAELAAALAALVATGAVTDLHLRSFNTAARRVDLAPLIAALADSAAVRAIALSGNGMTDSDATRLAKALRSNRTLTALEIIPRNSFSLRGLQVLAEALAHHRRVVSLGRIAIQDDTKLREGVDAMIAASSANAKRA